MGPFQRAAIVGGRVNVQHKLVQDRLDLFHDKVVLIQGGRAAPIGFKQLGINGIAEDSAEIEQTEDEDERVFASCAHGTEAGRGYFSHIVQRDTLSDISDLTHLRWIQKAGKYFHFFLLFLSGGGRIRLFSRIER